MIEFFVDENTPDILWEKAFEVTRRKSGQPAFYNPKVLQDGLMKRFPSIKEEDVRKFCGGGCTEAMLMGLSNVGSLDAGINFLLILEKTLKEKLSASASFDEFYEEFIKDSRAVVDMITAGINKNREMRAKYNPLPMRTLLIDDCIDRGVDFNSFGSRYSWSIINFAGLINVIDSLLAVKDLVYDRKKYTAEELLGFLEANDEAFAAEARKLDIRYGIDDPFVNSFANKLSDELFSMLDGVELWHGLGFLPASIQFNSMAYAGMDVGATPDGRRAKEPIADSLGAIFGKDTEGPTALLNSVTSLRLDKALGVPVLNFNIQPDFSDDVLKALILGYMKKGGAQMQISCISKEDLLDALKNPDKYGSLVVRVGGYSEYFNCLEEKTKWVVINRTVQTNI